MPSFIVTTDIVGPGIAVDLDFSGDAYIARQAIAASTSNVAIRGTGNHNVTVAGEVVSLSSRAIDLGDSNTSDAGQSVTILQTGIVQSFSSSVVAVFGLNSRVVNYGQVIGEGFGIGFASSNGTVTIENHGSITTDTNGILSLGSNNTSLLVRNFGTIISPTLYSHFGEFINDTFVNRGLMVGNLDMGSGADTYDGRGGELIGEINGGAGNDTFYAGAEAEQFVGGVDFDQLSYVYSRVAVTVTLDDPSLNTGDAFGDTITGIEVIVGTAAGNDFLRGDAGNNVLVGHNGNDTMFGIGGADTLRGDRGNDTLGGGMGDDAFRFLSVNDGIDTILDFSSVGAGNNDTIQISAAGFGAGLVAGALNPLFFQSRADNLAQDADDRFIFRTSDQTLWFDSNGSAAGGLTQLADLQTGATMTSLDIVLI